MALGPLGVHAAARLEWQFLAQRLAVLGDVGDLGYRARGADVAGVDEVALFAAEEGEAEVADRGVGDDRDGGLQAAAFDRGLVSARGISIDLAVEDEGEARQSARARDRVDRARSAAGRAAASSSSPSPIGWRPAHCVAASSVSEQMLPRWRWSICEGVGERHRERLDVGVAGSRPEVELRARVGGAAVALRPPSWLIVIFGLKGRVAQLTTLK